MVRRQLWATAVLILLVAVAMGVYVISWTSPCHALYNRIRDMGGTAASLRAGVQIVLDFGDGPHVTATEIATLFNDLASQDCVVTSVEIWHHRLSDDAVAAIARLSTIKRLVFVYCNVGDHESRHLRALRHLKVLTLLGTDVTRMPPLAASAYAGLEGLSLSRTQIDGNCFRDADFMPSLRELDLERTAVDDDAVPFISALPAIKQLNLSFCKLSEDSAMQLAKLSTLNILLLAGTDWSLEAYLNLCRLPNLREIWVGLRATDRHELQLRARGLGLDVSVL